MSLKKYDELTKEEIKKVTLMYSDHETLGMFLYNFDEHGNYHGRQYAPPSGKTEKGQLYGIIHTESVVPEVSGLSEKTVEDKKPVKDDIEDKPVKKVSRKSKKK